MVHYIEGLVQDWSNYIANALERDIAVLHFTTDIIFPT